MSTATAKPTLLDPRSAARLLGVTQRALRDLVAAGELRVIKPTCWSVRFDPADLDKYRRRVRADA